LHILHGDIVQVWETVGLLELVLLVLLDLLLIEGDRFETWKDKLTIIKTPWGYILIWELTTEDILLDYFALHGVRYPFKIISL
jgi:hypothetical protein